MSGLADTCSLLRFRGATHCRLCPRQLRASDRERHQPRNRDPRMPGKTGHQTDRRLDMPVFEKRRFQHGAVPKEVLREKLPYREAEYRRQFLSLYR